MAALGHVIDEIRTLRMIWLRLRTSMQYLTPAIIPPEPFTVPPKFTQSTSTMSSQLNFAMGGESNSGAGVLCADDRSDAATASITG